MNVLNIILNRCINNTCVMYYMYLSCVMYCDGMSCHILHMSWHVMSCIAIRWLGKDIQLKGLFDDHKAVMERTGLDHRYNYVP